MSFVNRQDYKSGGIILYSYLEASLTEFKIYCQEIKVHPQELKKAHENEKQL